MNAPVSMQAKSICSLTMDYYSYIAAAVDNRLPEASDRSWTVGWFKSLACEKAAYHLGRCSAAAGLQHVCGGLMHHITTHTTSGSC